MSHTDTGAFVDSAVIEVSSGRGGDGASHFRREKYMPRGGPDGGDGGRGGDVILAVDANQRTLVDFRFRRKFEAESGQPGGLNDRTGANGESLTIPVPAGTLVFDDDTGALIVDLSATDQFYMACNGGRGGHGNAFYVSPQNQATIMRELGEPGVTRRLRLELKLLADAALVGFPNAGKSTLISRLSAARPKVADYPFTTLTPHLGVVRLDDGASFVLADLPGLIEGAAEGRGLGHEFLRHLERAHVIVHLVDLSTFERPNPVADYRALRAELRAYDERLAQLPELVVGTKLDLVDDRDWVDIIAEELVDDGVAEMVAISAVTGEGIDDLRDKLAKLIAQSAAASVIAQAAAETLTAAKPVVERGAFEIREDEDEEVYVVVGAEVERMVAMTDLDNEESVMHLHRQLQRLGLLTALREAGCVDGDVVRVGKIYLDFAE